MYSYKQITRLKFLLIPLFVYGLIGKTVASCIFQKDLTAQEFPIGIMLSWATLQENNNDLFIVEKSLDGISFNSVGNVKGAGNSADSKSYNFLDPQANKGKAHYRLKIVDLDGSFAYSELLSLNKKGSNNFMIAQLSNTNITKEIAISIDAVQAGELKYAIKNLMNQVVFENKKWISVGLNDLMLDMSYLKPDTYKVELVMADEVESLILKRVATEAEAKPNVANNQGTLKRNK